MKASKYNVLTGVLTNWLINVIIHMTKLSKVTMVTINYCYHDNQPYQVIKSGHERTVVEVLASLTFYVKNHGECMEHLSWDAMLTVVEDIVNQVYCRTSVITC